MSGATFKIECEHKPDSTDDSMPWVARVYQLSDPKWCVHAVWDATVDLAVAKARGWIALQAKTHAAPDAIYTDDDGNIVSAHSVKA